MTSDRLTIGQAMRATGTTRKAIRLYEQHGLLPPPERTPAGYRTFTPADIELLIFIRRARTLGLHLDDIRDILTVRRAGTPPCPSVRELIDRRVAEIDTTLAELGALRASLIQTRRVHEAAADKSSNAICPIIEHSHR